MPEEFKDVIFEFFDRSKFNHEQIAKQTGIKQHNFPNWIQGKSRPKKDRWPEQMLMLADVLGCNPLETDRLFKAAELPLWHEIRLNTLDQTAQEAYHRIIARSPNLKAEPTLPKPPLTTTKQDSINQTFVMSRPGPNQHFVGRKDEINKILSKLRQRAVYTICGTGGVGKTALAVEITWRLAPDNEKPPDLFPDGIVYLSLNALSDIDSVFESIALFFIKEDLKPNARTATQRLLGRHQLLLVLDGAEHIDNLMPLVNILGRCAMLLTSRDRSKAIGDEIEDNLSVLKPNEARELLESWAKNYAQNTPAVEELCSRAGYFPLAIYLIGKHLSTKKITAKEYLSVLRKRGLGAVDILAQSPEEKISVILATSIEQIGKSEQKLLTKQILGLVGLLAFGLFDQKAIFTALDCDESTELGADVIEVLGELVQYGLLDRSLEKYEAAHALIHEYAYDEFHSDVTENMITRLANYYSTPTDPSQEDSHTISIHVQNLIRHCESRTLWASILNLAEGIFTYVEFAGNLLERQFVIASGVSSAEALVKDKQSTDLRSENQYQYGKWLSRQGNMDASLGKLEIAIEHLNSALARIHYSIQTCSDPKIRTQRETTMGQLERNLGATYLTSDPEEAIVHLSIGLEIAERTNDLTGVCSAWNNLGLAHLKQENPEKAIKCYETALELSQKMDASPSAKQSIMISLGNLGNAYASVGNYQQALSCYEKAENISGQIGDARNQVKWLNNMGHVNQSLGKQEEAKKHFSKALNIGQKLDDRPIQEIQLRNMIKVCNDLGDIENVKDYNAQLEAITVHDQKNNSIDSYELTLHQARGNHDVFHQFLALKGLAYQYLRAGQMTFAIAYYEQAIDAAREIMDYREQGRFLFGLGVALLLSRQETQAIARCRQGFNILQKFGNKEDEGAALVALGHVYGAFGHLEQALKELKQGLKTLSNIDSPIANDLQKLIKRVQTIDAATAGNLFWYLIRYATFDDAEMPPDLLNLLRDD